MDLFSWTNHSHFKNSKYISALLSFLILLSFNHLYEAINSVVYRLFCLLTYAEFDVILDVYSFAFSLYFIKISFAQPFVLLYVTNKQYLECFTDVTPLAFL